MDGRRRRATRAADAARLGVLSLLLAGFLSMHGFLAVSAASVSHDPASATVHAHATVPAHATGAVAPGPVVADGPAEPGSSPHTPVDHHGVLAGCVVALVGVALLTLGVLSSLRRRPLLMGRIDRLAATVRHVVVAGPVGWSLPRISLCVIRV